MGDPFYRDSILFSSLRFHQKHAKEKSEVFEEIM